MSQKNIDAYVDAVRALRALEQAEKDEGKSLSRRAAITQAKADAKIAYAKLAGREAWTAQRRLAVNPNSNGGN